MFASHTLEKPSIYVTVADLEQLTEIAEAARSPGALLLARELERAVVIEDGKAPHAFVRLDTRVEYRDLLTGRTRTVTVVRPGGQDMDHDRVSVLTPVGAALFGLSAGDTFSFSTDDGRPRVLEVLNVTDAEPAEPDARQRK